MPTAGSSAGTSRPSQECGLVRLATSSFAVVGCRPLTGRSLERFFFGRDTASAEESRSICAETRAPGVSVAQVARRHALNADPSFKWLMARRVAPADTARAWGGVRLE